MLFNVLYTHRIHAWYDMVCILTYTWLICLVNVGKFSDAESYGMIYATLNDRWCCDGRSCFKPSKIRNHGTEMGSMHGQLCLQQIILKRDINSHPWKFTCPLKNPETGKLHPWKWTWNPKMNVWKMLLCFSKKRFWVPCQFSRVCRCQDGAWPNPYMGQ